MKLEEALKICSPFQYLACGQWADLGIMLRIIGTGVTLKKLQKELSEECFNATDWDVYEVNT